MFKIESLITKHIKANKTIGMSYVDNNEPLTVFYSKNERYVRELLAVMSGIDEPLNGTIFYDDVPFNQLSYSKKAISISNEVAVIGIEYQCEDKMTIYESLKNVLYLNGFKRNEIKTLVNEQIEFFNLYNFKNDKIENLDDANRLNYFFARAIIKQPKYLLINNIEKYLNSTTEIEQYKKLIDKVKNDFKIQIIIFTHLKRIEYLNAKITNLDEYALSKKSINDEIVINTEFEIKRTSSRKFGVSNCFQVMKLLLKSNLYGVLAMIAMTFTILLSMNYINIVSITPNVDGLKEINTVFTVLCILFLISFLFFSFWAINSFYKTNLKNLIYFISNGVNKITIYLIIPLMIMIFFGVIIAVSFLLAYGLAIYTTDMATVELSLSIWIMLLSYVILVIYTFIISIKVFKNHF